MAVRIHFNSENVRSIPAGERFDTSDASSGLVMVLDDGNKVIAVVATAAIEMIEVEVDTDEDDA